MAQQTERAVAVGIFDNRQSAEIALERLRDAGFQDEEIGFLHHTEDAGQATDPATVVPKTESGAATGAVAGGVAGGVVGALLTGLIPGIGPVLAGGILLGALGGATLGAAGGVVRSLLDLGVPEEESRLYEQQFATGKSILAVKAGERYGEAISILRGSGAAFVRREHTVEAAEEYRPGNPEVVPESGAGTEEHMETTEDEEPARRFGWERATAPERRANHWVDAEPVLRRDWEAEHPETPWITVVDLVREGWESANTTTRMDAGLSDSASGSPLDRGKAA